MSYTESGYRILSGSAQVLSGTLGYGEANALSSFAIQGKQIVEEARNSQINSKNYGHADDWNIKLMSEGDTVWGGEPGQSNFYTTNDMVESVGTDATKLYKGLQVTTTKEYPQYREFLTEYQFKQDTLVGTSKALANSHISPGGFDQYYVSDYKIVLDRVTTITMTNR